MRCNRRQDFAREMRFNAVETLAFVASMRGKSKDTHAAQFMIWVISAHKSGSDPWLIPQSGWLRSPSRTSTYSIHFAGRLSKHFDVATSV